MYKRQALNGLAGSQLDEHHLALRVVEGQQRLVGDDELRACLLYTSDAADERSSVDLGGRRIINKKNRRGDVGASTHINKK